MTTTTVFEERVREEALEKQARTLKRAQQDKNRAKHRVQSIRDGPA
jgi:hypothetical protein